MSLKSIWALGVVGTAISLPCLCLAGAQQGNPAVAQSSSEAETVLANAIELQQAGDLEGAIRQYQIFLARSPNQKSRTIAYSNLGAALAHLGRYDEAIEQYRQALRAIPEGSGDTAEASEIHFNLALAYYKAGQIPGATRELAALSQSQPDNMKVLLLLADCDLRMGANKQAVGLLSPLEPKHQDDRALSYLLGTALIHDNQIDRGQKVIDRILRDGDSAEARLLMGSAKLRGHDVPGAIVDLRRAIELNSRQPSAHAIYAQALLQSGSPEQAADAFTRELEINPNDFDSNLYLGVLARQDRNYNDALRFLQRALEVRPGDPAVRYQIGALHLSTEKLEEARQELEQVIKDAPDFVEAHVSLATVYYREKRKQDGDRERAIIQKLNAEIQSRQPGVKGAPGGVDGGGAQPPPR